MKEVLFATTNPAKIKSYEGKLKEKGIKLKTTKLVKEYGGKLTAKWVYGMAVYNEKGKKTYTWSKDQFYFVDKPSKKRNPGYPLDSITIVPEFNKYLVELTEEEKSKCKKNNNTQEIVSFILDNI